MIMRNKPNSRRPGYLIVPIRCRLYKTKPIPARRNAAWGSGFPSHPSALPVDCAKQTQFRQRDKKRQMFGRKGLMVNCTSHRHGQNKANSGRSPVGRGQRDVGRGTNAPNEPNLVRAPTKGRGWPPNPAGARRRQTKPICRPGLRGAGDGQVASRAGVAAYGAKQTQCAAAGRGRPSPRPEALTLPPTRTNMRNEPNLARLEQGRVSDGETCRTNPIPRGRAEARDVESAIICRPHPRETDVPILSVLLCVTMVPYTH
jgi:hypothetical protein